MTDCDMEKKDCKMNPEEVLELSLCIKRYLSEKGYGHEQVLEFLSADLIANMGSMNVSKETFKEFCDLLSDEFNSAHDRIKDISEDIFPDIK